MSKTLRACAVLAALIVPPCAGAHSAGITGYSGNPSINGGATCANCHSGGNFVYNDPVIVGPGSVTGGTTAAYTLSFTRSSGTNASAAGFDLSANGGTLLDPDTSDNSVKKVGAELTHGAPRTPVSGDFSWSFNWQAPGALGTYRFYVCSNPVNGNGFNTMDGPIQCANQTITVTNAAPVANDDAYSTPPDNGMLVIEPGVLANDTDLNGDPLTAALVTDVSHGTLSLAVDGGFSYTPNGGFSGIDSFTYTTSDGTATSNMATATITVGTNVTPVAVADSYQTPRGVALVVAAPGVLVNDSDSDEADTLSANLIAAPTHGSVALSPSGAFTYTPQGGFSGADSFTYQANDGTADSNVVTVSLTVTAPGGGGGGGGAPAPLLLGVLGFAALLRRINRVRVD